MAVAWGTFYFKDNNIGRHFKVDIFTGMSVPMYVCSKPKGVNFAYFYNFSIEFCNYSDSVVHCIFSFSFYLQNVLLIFILNLSIVEVASF